MFGRDKLDISIQKTSYAAGDTISGAVALTLNKPVKAREMTISLIGEYMTTVIGRRARSNTVASVRGTLPGRRTIGISDAIGKSMPAYDLKKSTETVRTCAFKQQLDGEGEYSQSREYHFEIKITADIPTSSVVNWYLLAKLDIPHGRDATKKVRITIG